MENIITQLHRANGNIEIHTCWDDVLMIPDMVNITEAKLHESKGLSQSVFRKGTVTVEDRAYFDFLLKQQRIVVENVLLLASKPKRPIKP